MYGVNIMKLLEDRIRRDGIIKPDHVLKVDSFLNHQMDIELFGQMAEEWKRLFAKDRVNKILTIEASGIGIASIVAERFKVPMVYAKRAVNVDIDGEVYETQVESFSQKRVYNVIVSKKFLKPEDRVLIIDDFLANGCAVTGMVELVHEAGATVVGVGVAIEKGFNIGGKLLRESGIRVESLAIVDGMNAKTGEIYFHN